MEFIAITVTTYDWKVVVAAMGEGHSQCPSQPRETVALATHSVGGRDWVLHPGSAPGWVEDDFFDGGWVTIRRNDAAWLRLSSASSGTEVEATRLASGMWELALHLPIQADGTPYMGSYARIFLGATEGLRDEQLDYELLEAIELSFK